MPTGLWGAVFWLTVGPRRNARKRVVMEATIISTEGTRHLAHPAINGPLAEVAPMLLSRP